MLSPASWTSQLWFVSESMTWLASLPLAISTRETLATCPSSHDAATGGHRSAPSLRSAYQTEQGAGITSTADC